VLKKKLILLFSMVGFAGVAFSQSPPSGFFHPESINGNIRFMGLYRMQKSLIGDVAEDQRSTYYIGGIMLNTTSYLWSPDILYINLDVEYNPESRDETYLLVPDRSEVRTLKKLDFRTAIFRNKSVSLSTFVNLNQTYFNRELLTNIKSDNKQWGGIFSVYNKFLPLSVSYRQSDWKQDELQTGRVFTMKQNDFTPRISKSFGNNDSHELLYSKSNYYYNYAGSPEVKNLIDKVTLTDNIFFDKDRKFNFNSYVSYYNQAGDYEFEKIEANERLLFNLPANLRFTGGYMYNRLKDPTQVLTQNRILGSLNHRLFESLTTNVYADYSGISQTIYDENNLRAGAELNYTKKIPTGRLNLSYRYYRSYFDMKGVSAPLKIINEEHTISDSQTTILNRPYVDLSTLVVKDQAGIILYQENFDYIVTVRNNYVEIQRIPGGQILNGQSVTVSYTATQPGSYSYIADNNTFSSSILLFGKLIELYYTYSVQDYNDLVQTDYLTLNYFNQNIAGIRIDLGVAGAGVEYDEYNSNVIPYKRYRYFIDLNLAFRDKLLVALNGNLIDYKLIDDDVNQIHANINGKISYLFSHRTRLDFDAGYLRQRGKNIDLDLISSKLEISTSFRQLYLKGGLEMYRRHYLNSDFDFAGTFIELVRKF
jgi:hypothetical protein